jgi:hypothetical protein
MKQVETSWIDFHKICDVREFYEILEAISVLRGTSMTNLYKNLLQVLSGRKLFGTNVAGNNGTCILFPVHVFRNY